MCGFGDTTRRRRGCECRDFFKGELARAEAFSTSSGKTHAGRESLFVMETKSMSGRVPQVGIKRILVPTDFSEPSRAAAVFAGRLAGRLAAELIILHVCDLYLGTGDLFVDVARMQANTEQDGADRLTEFAKEIERPARLEVRIGAPAHQIVEAARDFGADLIVIPTHGRSAIARFFIGGVAERVVRHADCPVLVLPWDKRDATPHPKWGDRVRERVEASGSFR